jgi:hypothetical protein
MEHSIGIGVIVGLTFASSVFVWNSQMITSAQKTFLLICILFPPVQWLGIIIVLAYNSNKVNNSAEKVAERKVNERISQLEFAISNLTELNEKGLLNKEEYLSKVEKIEIEKAEIFLKNSLEYQQLKSLLDTGFLTKEEFDIKTQLLKNETVKDVDMNEISKILNSANDNYIRNKQ